MKMAGTSNKNRPRKGQALVEGTVIMVLATTLALGLTVFLLNVAKLASYNYRLQVLASQGARQIIANGYWMHMTRSGYHLAGGATEPDGGNLDIGKNCAYLIDEELTMMGMAKSKNFFITKQTSNVNGTDVTIIQVDFDVPNLDIVAVAGFVPKTTLHAHGVASSSKYAVSTHGIGLIHVIDRSTTPPVERAVRVPIYNATIGNDTSADTVMLKAGHSIGLSSTATVNLYCKNDGVLNLPTGPKPWGPWPSELNATQAAVPKE